MAPTATILLADDSITIQKVMQLTFDVPAYELATVGDGDAACAWLRNHRPPSVVIADIHMPKKAGYEAAPMLRASTD